MSRLAMFVALLCTAKSLAQAENPVLGLWQCATVETARDNGRIVGKFRGTVTLRFYADQTVTGDGPGLKLAGHWTGRDKRLALELGSGTMRGSLAEGKLVLGFATVSNREASVSTSWTCTKLVEAER